MVFVLFGVAAIVTIFVAVKLSVYADVISLKSAVGGMAIGAILLSLATSLPEVTTSVTAVMINNPDLAIGNLLGSNLFNMLIIATLDIYFRKKYIFQTQDINLRMYALLSMFLSLVVYIALVVRLPFMIFGVGLDSLILIALYALGMTLISRTKTTSELNPDTSSIDNEDNEMPLKHAYIGFVIAAALIMLSGSILAITGDRIAIITGLGSSFVGSFLIAASTSLPEAVSCYAAIRLKNETLAIGSALSSNLFNLLILGGTDLFFRTDLLFSAAHHVHQVTALGGITLVAVVYFSIIRKQKQGGTYVVPSISIVVLYFIFSLLIFLDIVY